MRGSNHMNVNIVNVPMLKWVICIVMLEKHIMLNPIKFEVKKDVKINMKCDTCSKKKLSSMKFQLSIILKTLLATLIYITKTRMSEIKNLDFIFIDIFDRFCLTFFPFSILLPFQHCSQFAQQHHDSPHLGCLALGHWLPQ